MNNLNPEFMSQMELLMILSARKIFEGESSEAFLSWAKQQIPVLAPMLLDDQPQQQIQQTAYWTGVALWNSAPIPSNHFKPLPLPKPSRNDSCPCGSDRKYKQCCAALPPLAPLPTEAFWHFLMMAYTKAEILRLCQGPQIPITAIIQMADKYAKQQEHAQAIKMLNHIFEHRSDALSHKHQGVIDLTCDCFDAHYKTTRKKMALLEGIKNHKSREIRAEALQRLAGIYQDQGKHKAAMQALSEAMRANPHDPNSSLLELTLLITENQLEQARKRAAFWYQKWKKHRDEMPELIDTLYLAQSNPLAALHQSISLNTGDERLQKLQQYVTTAVEVNPASYHYQSLAADTHTSDQDVLEDPIRHAGILIPSDEIKNLEQQWFELTPVEKPFSVDYDNEDTEDIWSDPEDDEWLEFIAENPSSLSSLNILDDLTTLLYQHPLNHTPFKSDEIETQILQRTLSILQLANIPEPGTLPWIVQENRPSLRLLSHAINLAKYQERENDHLILMQLYLRLNPMDNHGYRSELINHYLIHQQNQQAIELAKRFPDDMMAETCYGEVLAHYRMGDLQAAAASLKQAIDSLPKVAEYLIKSRVAKPEFHDYGISIGGEDQAWLYREDMHKQWASTKGCLEWMKKCIAKL